MCQIAAIAAHFHAIQRVAQKSEKFGSSQDGLKRHHFDSNRFDMTTKRRPGNWICKSNNKQQTAQHEATAFGVVRSSKVRAGLGIARVDR